MSNPNSDTSTNLDALLALMALALNKHAGTNLATTDVKVALLHALGMDWDRGEDMPNPARAVRDIAHTSI